MVAFPDWVKVMPAMRFALEPPAVATVLFQAKSPMLIGIVVAGVPLLKISKATARVVCADAPALSSNWPPPPAPAITSFNHATFPPLPIALTPAIAVTWPDDLTPLTEVPTATVGIATPVE
ncbi:hypothetical protein IMCC26134_14295 [Verrucomicrobia bacterium IMCC26134]|nr:hypothetical protein IMCC26134_14295 [Verrucomicrobia bacterium IMCC26134]